MKKLLILLTILLALIITACDNPFEPDGPTINVTETIQTNITIVVQTNIMAPYSNLVTYANTETVLGVSSIYYTPDGYLNLPNNEIKPGRTVKFYILGEDWSIIPEFSYTKIITNGYLKVYDPTFVYTSRYVRTTCTWQEWVLSDTP